MKLQLGISQIVFAWIFWALLLVCLVNEGSGCLANTCIILPLMMFCGKFENFIHFPTWSYGAICRLLDQKLAPKEVTHALK
jgi:hypothetical protein